MGLDIQQSTLIVFDSEVKKVAEMPESAVNSSPIAAETLPTLAEIHYLLTLYQKL